MHHRWFSRLALLALLSWTARAQPAFEVASIRSHGPEVHSVGLNISGPRVTVEAFSLTNIITYAFDLQSYQVLGGPDWARSDRYDIAAKAEGEGTVTKEQVREMLKTLAADRFKVQVHTETREMPVYLLVVAKGGPKLKESAPDATSLMMMSSPGRTTRITTTRGSMDQLALQFSNANGVDRPVLNKTGLSGGYDYKLNWTPGLAPADSDPEAPTIFTALQEQLGLRLEPQRASVEVLIIDRAEKPGEN